MKHPPPRPTKESTASVLSSLGLSNVAPPSVLRLSNKEKLKKKVEGKKAKREVIAKAMEMLTQSKVVVHRHSEYMKNQAVLQKAERTVRHKKTQCEQIISRRARETAQKTSEEFVTGYDLNACIERVETEPMEWDEMTGEDDPAVVNAIPYTIVPVTRDSVMESHRAQLPAVRYEQEVMEAVRRTITDSCVIVCGETGSGKTTQVPQFLWEHGFPGLIGVTQPRRVAAYAMAERVSKELGETLGIGVGYQVRYNKKLGKDDSTRLKFMTEGILLREVQDDFALSKYSAIVLDEAHERSVTIDVLLGLLSRIVPLRASLGKPLCVIIMSATLRVTDFTENTHLYRSPPKVVHIESRTYTVKSHFSLHNSTRASYLEDAHNKIAQVHTKLPPGAIVCFVPTQKDCETLAGDLKRYFENTPTRRYDDEGFRAKLNTAFTRKQKHEKVMDETNQGEVSDGSDGEDDDDADYDLNDESGGDAAPDKEDDPHDTFDTLHVLPLYSNLPPEKQNLVFDPAPAGKRLCVIATNVAETSLTIPMVRYVVDTGLVKEKMYDAGSNIHKYRTTWVSQSSANQRCGRAGRVAPGHCYRLYTPATFSTFPDFSDPEISRTPLESVVLMMRQFGIQHVERFPFPSRPPSDAIAIAVESLTRLGALTPDGVTELGGKLLAFPVVPRFAVMLVRAQAYLATDPKVVAFVIDAVAVAASVVDPFLPGMDAKSQPVSSLRHPGSDMHTCARSLWGYRRASDRRYLVTRQLSDRRAYCAEHSLIAKFMREAEMLSTQITNHMGCGATTTTDYDSDLAKPHELLFRKIVCSGLLDSVARIATPTECEEAGVRVESGRGCHVAYVRPTAADAAPHRLTTEVFFIHPKSSVAKTVPVPEWVTFTALETNVVIPGSSNKVPRVLMRGVTATTLGWLHEVGY